MPASHFFNSISYATSQLIAPFDFVPPSNWRDYAQGE
jgi:hypothetical protein